MPTTHQVDELLKARAEIDEQLRKHKNALTVLFTDVVGSTSFFQRNGDTAGLVMIHRHDEVAARAIQLHDGVVVKTIGDSAMAEFPNPASAVRAAVEIERQFLKLNLTLPEDQRVEVRIGVHTGVGFRKGNDLFGDVVNVTARIVKRTAPAQILISRALYDLISKETDLHCRWLNKITIDGRVEQEDIFEVVWTDVAAYRDIQDRLATNSHIPARYEALSKVGTGGTGIVYKVRDLETDEIVALKILKPEMASDPDVQENLKRELCLARKITHKNVCRIHEFSRSNGIAYTSMEFVEGESLSSRLNRVGALPVSEAIDFARQICAGLREAHAQGIVHRDLKPANIMVDRNSTVKIMDFGIARMIQRDGPATGTIVGTPAYMAPEQAELKPVSSCTDIYALGLLLYEMITGAPAFDGDTPVAVALKQIREYPKKPREIVPELTRSVENVIMKCLQKDPAKRFQSATDLEFALVKASKARRASPVEAAVNLWMDRAEVEVREIVCEAADATREYWKRQDWRALLTLQEDPKAMLGVTGIVSALSVFLLFGAWKPRTINAQPVTAGNHAAQTSAANAATPAAHAQPPAPHNSFEPIASHEVDLYGDLKAPGKKVVSSDPIPVAKELRAATVVQPTAAEPPQIAKAPKAAAPATERKPHSKAPRSIQLEAPASPVQAANAVAAESATTAAAEPAADSAQPSAQPESIFPAATTILQTKAAGNDPTAPKLYVEVGSFKDETWANNAVDKLNQLGFHTQLVHKNLLWSQSYHVQVGPYADRKGVEEAQKSLTSQGFKAHPVN